MSDSPEPSPVTLIEEVRGLLGMGLGKGSVSTHIPKIRGLARDLNSRYPDMTFGEATELMDDLCEGRKPGEILFGIFLVSRFRRHFGSSLWERIEAWAEAVEDPDICDQLGLNITGEVLAHDFSLLQNLVAWAESENPWLRRLAAASTVALNHGWQSHNEITFQVCMPLLAETDPQVQKAIGWALREVGKKDEASLVTFLQDHRGDIHTRILVEASQKLSSSQRAELLKK